MTTPLKKLPDPLLIVDDREEVLTALARFMGLYFEKVLSASTPDEAEALLRTHAPRYLLCDYWLGQEYPPSTAYIPRWRREYPSLQRVVLMTGTKSSSITPCPEVDEVFQKPLDTKRLIDFFAR